MLANINIITKSNTGTTGSVDRWGMYYARFTFFKLRLYKVSTSIIFPRAHESVTIEISRGKAINNSAQFSTFVAYLTAVLWGTSLNIYTVMEIR
jgi:hypothetical protein